MNDLLEFQKQQIAALQKELYSVRQTLLEISEISTREAKRIKVRDAIFLEPIKK